LCRAASKNKKMRKLLLKTDVSLDGFREGPKGEMDWFPTESGPEWRELGKLMRRVDTVILGRGMYAGYSGYWQGVLAAPEKHGKDEVTYARWADKTRHIVFSRKIKKVDWHMEIMRDAVKGVRSLKARAGKDILVYGGSKFAGLLADQGLVDEYYIHVLPVLLGGGKPLFRNIAHRQTLKQVGVKALSSQSVWLTYTK
jgi:dihydrofolate reductase